jgi:hypothetical protein
VLSGEEPHLGEVEGLHLSWKGWAILWGSAVGVLAVLVAAAFLAGS